MGRSRNLSTDHPSDLFQFLHQIDFGLQPAGSVNDDSPGLTGISSFNSIKRDCGWIGTLLLLNQFYAAPIAPNLQLLDRCGAKRVRSSDDHIAALRIEPCR